MNRYCQFVFNRFGTIRLKAAMKQIRTYQIYPTIPAPLAFLETLSRNLWWCWKPDAVELFRRIDPSLWKRSNSNPIHLLAHVDQTRLEHLAEDDSYLAHLQRVQERFAARVVKNECAAWAVYENHGPIAYLSMEFGIHESIPLFAGGLGILAGDHLKAASNLALPLVGVGLMYHKGYLQQYLDQEGWQQEYFPEIELHYLPVERARDAQGNEITITLTGPEGDFRAFVWRIRVGRTHLFLLDTNLPENPPEAREITSRLYMAEPKIRLAQEFLLGIGGIRALSTMGIFPSICHMNEGHSAFSALERLALLMQRQAMDLQTALQVIRRSTVFTTHTPVAAGHDAFPSDMVRPWLKPLQASLGVSIDEILSWGQPPGADPNCPLSMFILGARMSQYCNGVSSLHGRTARRMWAHLWPGLPEDEIPISQVTNGIHISTFISPDIASLFERHLGPEWYMSSRKPENIERIDEIYDDELWRAHEMSRTRLIRICRELLRLQYERRNAPRKVLAELDSVLSPETLTIAFARRFAAYKRADLLLQDANRLAALINNPDRPVQVIFAGKAHPKAMEGKEIIKRVIAFVRQPHLRQRMVFIEGYDMALGRALVQGADVWLNTPRRPMEACGTSGMKAAANGVLNVSILDGWWCEGYTEDHGWCIGQGEEFQDPVYQDAVESQALFNLLENEVIPCFYDRHGNEQSNQWVKMMKAAMKMAMARFCSLRMVTEYEARFYRPIVTRLASLIIKNGRESRELAHQEARLRAAWQEITIGNPAQDGLGPFRVGENFHVSADIRLGRLTPQEVDVELYTGQMRSVDRLQDIEMQPMVVVESLGAGCYRYGAEIPCRTSGRYGFTVRVTPRGDSLLKYIPGLITWA